MSKPIKASDVNTLKTKVKNEMNRRNGYGSLTSYAGAAYDFSTTPVAGQPIKADQIKKIVEPISKIKAYNGLTTAVAGSIIPDTLDIAGMTTHVNSLASNTMTPNGTNDCAASCTGLCVSQCSGTCTSCTGTCSGVCGGCGGCGDACTGCSGCGGCGTGCGGTCGGCGGCGGCGDTCSGCGSTCGGGCAFSCTGDCS